MFAILEIHLKNKIFRLTFYEGQWLGHLGAKTEWSNVILVRENKQKPQDPRFAHGLGKLLKCGTLVMAEVAEHETAELIVFGLSPVEVHFSTYDNLKRSAVFII